MGQLRVCFKWRYLRYLVAKERLLFKKRKLRDDERAIKDLLIKIISNPNSVVLVSPLSNTIYIRTEDKSYCMIISEDIIKISNHRMFIETPTSFFFSKKIYKIIHFYVEKHKQQIENEMFNNEVSELNHAVNKLKSKAEYVKKSK